MVTYGTTLEESVAEIGIKEFKASASSVIDRVAEEGIAYVVTRRGKPAAVLLPVEDAEDLVLANADEFIRMRKRGRDEFRNGRTAKLKDLD